MAEDLRLPVRVYNFSGADSDVLFQAEALARRIFQDAGIETEWIAVDEHSKLDPSTLTVQIFAGRSGRSDMKDAFGIALIGEKESPSFLADVFFGNIEEAATSRKEAAILLGHVLAHEVGHLLLGAGHVSGTVMAGDLGGRHAAMEAGRLRFSQSLAGRLRAAVARRRKMP
jgi:hypothetical protein